MTPEQLEKILKRIQKRLCCIQNSPPHLNLRTFANADDARAAGLVEGDLYYTEVDGEGIVKIVPTV